MGTGWPAVVLVPGLGTDPLDWLGVQQRLVAVTQVLRWQREVPAADAPARDLDDLVDELHALLHEPGQRAGACVLVGHSFGGLVVRRYAQRHGQDVAGVVLVDAMHEDQFEVLGAAFGPPRADEPPALRRLRDFHTEGWRDPARSAERIDLPRSLQRLRDEATAFTVPLVVISAGSWLNARLFGDEVSQRLQAAWGALQNRLTGLSPDVEQVVLEDANHFVAANAPDALADAVHRLVQRLRAQPPAGAAQ